MIYRAVAIDDERYALDELELCIRRIPNLTLIATFETVEAAFQFLYEHGPVDVVFCDLDLDATGSADDLRGLEIAADLKDWCDLFFFFTGHPQYRVKAIDTSAAGYLMKPVDLEKIREGLTWLEDVRKKSSRLPDRIGLREVTTGVKVYVDLESINCVCTHVSEKDHLEFIMHDGLRIVVRMSLKAAWKRLATAGLFIQVSQSAIIAKSIIVKVNDNIVILADGHQFSVGKSFATAFYNYINRFG